MIIKKKVRNNFSQVTKKFSGFSLLELLVVIVIMGFMFTFGFAGYREFASRQKLNAIERIVKGDLRLAQQQAVAGKKPTDPAGNACTDSANALNFYAFRTSGNTYYIIANCGGNEVPVKYVDINQYYSNLSISTVNIEFYSLARGSNGGSVVLTDNNTSDTRTLEITQGGEIN